jgi:hypothetical protein
MLRITLRTYGNILRKHDENGIEHPFGTYWKHIGNMVGNMKFKK